MKLLTNNQRCLLAVALLSFLVYLPALRYGFVFDEQLLITNNPAVHDLSRLDRILGEKFWPGPAAGIYYRPVVTLSYALGYALAGEAPWLHHLANLLFHVVCSTLAFFLFHRLAKTNQSANLASLIFALHPLHTESVTWVPGRTDVLATLFMIAAWLLLLKAREKKGRARGGLYFASALSYLAALGAKEVAVVFLGLVVVWDLLQSRKPDRRYYIEYGVIVGITIAFLALRATILSSPGPEPAPPALAGLAPLKKLSAMVLIFTRGLGLLFLPGPWRIDYAHAEEIFASSAGLIVFSYVVILFLLGAIVLARKRFPLLAFSGLGFFLSMAPVSHLIPFPTLFAERFLYLPSLFVALFLAEVLTTPAFSTAWPRLWNSLLLSWLLLLGVFATIRGQWFHDDLRFWRASVRQVPELPAARNWLGIAYRDRKLWPLAEEQYRLALALDPNFSVAEMNLAEVLLQQGQTEAGVTLLQKLVQQNPEDPTLRANLGLAYLRQHQWELARKEAESALTLDPENFLAHLLLAEYHLKITHNRVAASAHLTASQKLRPHHPWANELSQQLQTSPPP